MLDLISLYGLDSLILWILIILMLLMVVLHRTFFLWSLQGSDLLDDNALLSKVFKYGVIDVLTL
jgi:hypothetical protein